MVSQVVKEAGCDHLPDMRPVHCEAEEGYYADGCRR